MKYSTTTSLFVFSVVVCCASIAAAQARINRLGSGALKLDPQPAEAAPVTESPQPAAASDAQPSAATDAELKQQRLQKIQQLPFDRRPSTILRVWAEEAAEKRKAELEQAKAAEEAAKPDAADPSNPAQDQPSAAAETTQPTGQEAAPTGTEDTSQPPAKDAPQGAGEAPASDAAGEQPGAADDPMDQAALQAKAEQEAAARRQEELQQLDEQLKQFQRHVTLGRWGEVRTYLSEGLKDEEEKKALFTRMLQSLATTPDGVPPDLPPEIRNQLMQFQQMRAQQQGQQPEKNVFSFQDVIAIAAAAPTELDDAGLAQLAQIIQRALENGYVVQQLIETFEQETGSSESDSAITRRQAARLLILSQHAVEAGPFLPALDKAIEENDHEALNLLTAHFLAVRNEQREGDALEQAWKATQAVLASQDIDAKEKETALRRAVELAPQVREELGDSWLKTSFTGQPSRGMDIIASIGGGAAQATQSQPHNPDLRLQSLRLQTTAVEALLAAAPERAESWKAMLELLAQNWLQEAELAHRYDDSTSLGPMLRRDIYGNYYYTDDPNDMGSMRYAGNRVRAIKTGELLEIKPSDDWLALLSDSLKPRFDVVVTQLYLKVSEDDRAFPYIEQLATTHPDLAQDLVDEFLKVWTDNHDPNASQRRTNPYMFMYGFERRAESIPLTRSKQQRNLQELKQLVARFRELPVELDEQLVARAFTTCHSSAEVYRLEAIAEVFGQIEDIEPKTLAELAQQMRANLAGVWRQPATQENAKTRRKQKDIQAEVQRGYGVARSVVESALEKYPDEWTLVLALAAIEHDENNYQRELDPQSDFIENRDDAFVAFARAADLYAQTVGQIPEDEETTRVYEIWYYASLGACDLGQIDQEKVPDLKQPARILEAIRRLPEDAAQRHLDMFANTLFTRMSAVNPGVKFRYLRGGFEIVGDHKQARDARKVYEYYKDLVTEIQLVTEIDGSDTVGHDSPFGVFVNLLHTREIERESGGFGRYLQNQNTGRTYYYNYGRPTEDYRDKFEQFVREALTEHFEVLSVTFQSEDVNSKATERYGWRVTPYAYLLLKARGPEVDKIPAVRIDLDFLDTSGYVVLPIESSPLPIDAAPENVEPRPAQNISVTQTLDERQADEGQLIVEIEATGHGLIPDLEALLDLDPAGFQIVETDDQGVSVSRFDPESDETLIVSERTWMVTFEARDSAAEMPELFAFGQPRLPLKEVVHQRYNDADLVTVERVVNLEEVYGKTSHAWIWWMIGLVLASMFLVTTMVILARRRHTITDAHQLTLPERLTPFTVLGLLRSIERSNGFGTETHHELLDSIHRLERYYFGQANGDQEPDLRRIAELWISRSQA